MFSYDPANLIGPDDDLSILLNRARLVMGDSKEDEGIRPNGGNWSDEEIMYALDTYSSSVPGAVSSLLRAAAYEWQARPFSWSADGMFEMTGAAATATALLKLADQISSQAPGASSSALHLYTMSATEESEEWSGD